MQRVLSNLMFPILVFAFIMTFHSVNAYQSITSCGPQQEVTGYMMTPLAERYGRAFTQFDADGQDGDPLQIVATSTESQRFMSFFYTLAPGDTSLFTLTIARQKVLFLHPDPFTAPQPICEWVVTDVKDMDGNSLHWDVTRLPFERSGSTFEPAQRDWLMVENKGYGVHTINVDAGAGGFDAGTFTYNNVDNMWSAVLVLEYISPEGEVLEATTAANIPSGGLVAINNTESYHPEEFTYLWLRDGYMEVLKSNGHDNGHITSNALWTMPLPDLSYSGWTVPRFMPSAGNPFFVGDNLYIQPITEVTSYTQLTVVNK